MDGNNQAYDHLERVFDEAEKTMRLPTIIAR
jgi:hypothetical protein